MSWGIADQALSSLTNFCLNLLIARTFGSERFGAFALVFGVYTFLLGIGRSITSEPMVVRHSASSVVEWSAAARAATGVSVLLGVGAGAACLGIGWVLGGPVGSGLVALGIGLPGLLVQDTWRFAFMACARAKAAFINDLIWAVSLAPIAAGVLLSGRPSLFWLALGWGSAATVAAVAGSLQARITPHLFDARRWMHRNWKLSRSLGPESITTSGTQLAVAYAISSFGGLASLGTIHSAALLLGPLNILFMATGLVAIPELVRLATRSTQAVGWASGVIAVILSGLALLVGAIFFALPDRTGEALLGTTWAAAREVLAPLVLMTAGTGVTIGAQLGLRALAAVRRSLISNLLASIILVTSTAIGARTSGAVGAAWGLALGRCLGPAVWWYQLARTVRQLPEHHFPAQPDPKEVVVTKQ